MQKRKIGIVILATNTYFVLGLRFIRRFMHFYKGDSTIVFYFFSDVNPVPFLPNDINLEYYPQVHSDWRAGTNSKFKNIVNIQYDMRKHNIDYVYYFDADTNVSKDFTEDWFLGDYVTGEHYGNRDWLAGGAGFDRNPHSKAYVSYSSPLPYTYRYGAFFGGTRETMIALCETLYKWQIIDQDKGYEPPNNDEGYLNAFFHNNPPSYTVPSDKFEFDISDKGGLEELVRHPENSIVHYTHDLINNKGRLFNLKYQKLVYDE